MIPTRSTLRLGFTLLEMLAVIALTSLVVVAVADYYLDLSRASQEAVDAIRDTRRAARLLDRMAHELEGSTLVVKPPETDPIEHPWVFYSEADDTSQGAQRVKFVTRSYRPAAEAVHEQDLALVSYVTEDDGAGGLRLWRAAAPQLPEELDLSFPHNDADGAQLLAEDLAAFGMRFLTEEGDWVARFDSSTLLNSGQLPLAAEIEVAFLELDDLGEQVQGPSYTRQVAIPVRPLDIEAELEAAGELDAASGEEDEAKDENDEGDESDEGDKGEEAATIQDCLDLVPDQQLALLRQQFPQQADSLLFDADRRPMTPELRALAKQFLRVDCP